MVIILGKPIKKLDLYLWDLRITRDIFNQELELDIVYVVQRLMQVVFFWKTLNIQFLALFLIPEYFIVLFTLCKVALSNLPTKVVFPLCPHTQRSLLPQDKSRQVEMKYWSQSFNSCLQYIKDCWFFVPFFFRAVLLQTWKSEVLSWFCVWSMAAALMWVLSCFLVATPLCTVWQDGRF